MRKEFTRVILVNAGIVIIFLVIMMISFGYHYNGLGAYRDVAVASGVILLVLSVLNILLAIAIAIGNPLSKKSNKYPQALLLFSALALLCSFSLCTTAY